MTDTPTLTEFLLARIADDERVARAAFRDAEQFGVNPPRADDGEWTRSNHVSDECRIDGVAMTIYDEGGHTAEQADHITRHDPARVLAECEAKRRIVDLAEDRARVSEEDDHSPLLAGQDLALRAVLLFLALPYDTHPDYREEWKP